jgi:hypothetical protein
VYFSFTPSSLLILSSSASLLAFNLKITEEHDKLWVGVDKTDPKEVERITKPILDELAEMEGQVGKLISPMTRMKSALAQVQRLVRLSKHTSPAMAYYFDQAEGISRAEDIQVLGAVIYTGKDAAAKQISAVFAGSTLCREVIDSHETSIRDVVDNVTTELKCALDCYAVA